MIFCRRVFVAFVLLAALPARAGVVSVTAVTEDVLCVEWRDGKARAATLGSGTDGRLEDLGKLDTAVADRLDTWATEDGPAVIGVGRKSKGSDFARVAEWDIAVAQTHWVYLKLAGPAAPGAVVKAAKLGVELPVAAGPTPVLQVNQLGYLPEMPKYVYASHWLGSAGGLDLAKYAGREFRVFTPDGKPVYEGRAELRWPEGKEEGAGGVGNLRKADLWQCDVSELRKPGRYVLEWPGVGRSREFAIGADVYEEAYRVSMAGLFHQRCGCALDKAHTRWPRAACHTGEVTLSDHRYTDGSNAFEQLPDKATSNKMSLPGGYHDAGDWDRHSAHLVVADALLFVFMAFPDRFADGELSVPEAGNRVPDIVDEARWGVDFFLQLQGEDGGVRGGVETSGHPKFGEASWTDSLPMYAYAPDRQASYRFAASAASLARAYAKLKIKGLRDRYLKAAERAWTWAQEDDAPGSFQDEQMHAAASLFAATGDDEYHSVFKRRLKVKSPKGLLESYGEYDQRWAVWIYMSCDQAAVDRGAQVVLGKASAHYANWLCLEPAAKRGRRQGYNWWKPFGHGALTVPDNLALIAAHRATGDAKYLEQMALNTDAPLGANALGICWITGLGSNPVQGVLHIDSWYDGIDEPVPGIVPYGPRRWEEKPGWTHAFGMNSLWAGGEEWPPEELWTGNFMSPAAAEFTVWETNAPAAAAFAYLRAASAESR